MAAASPAIGVPAPATPHASVAARSCAGSPKAPLQIVLAVLGLLWLVPTFGLFITSILPAVRARLEGLVADLLEAEPRHLVELRLAAPQPGLLTALKTTAYIAVGNTAARGDARRDGRLRVRVARVPRPRLALHRRDRPARRAAADGADPDVPRSTTRRHLTTRGAGIVLFHAAFGLPVRDLPAAELLRRASRRTSSSRRGSTGPARS